MAINAIVLINIMPAAEGRRRHAKGTAHACATLRRSRERCYRACAHLLAARALASSLFVLQVIVAARRRCCCWCLIANELAS